jgi:hypothetical protein
MHTHLLGVLKGGHWPTLMGAWLHLTLSFMVWLLIGALGVPIATTFGLSATETVTALAVPLLGGALLRVMGGWSCDWFGAKRTGVAVLLCELVAVIGDGWVFSRMSSCSLWDLCWGSETQVLPWRCRWRGERIHRLIWRNVFGLMAIPVVVTLAVFLALVRDDRAVGPRSVSKGDRTVRWWHAAVAP